MDVIPIPRTVDELAQPDHLRSERPSWAQHPELPFNARRVTLRPLETTAPHNHHDVEVWVILDGRGEVTSDGETVQVTAGDTVRLPPLGVHTVRNTETGRPLTFLTLWWEDMAALEAEHDRRNGAARALSRPVLLLPSFPTPNGALHLGHLAGPFLNADLVRRGLAARGTPVRLLLGTVGHQSQVAAAALDQGLTFYQLAERNTDAILQALAAAQIDWDVFVRPSSPDYAKVALEIFERLRSNGSVVTKTTRASYCTSCAMFLFEAFVAGACPHCGSRDTAGIECEACALPFSDHELLEPSCRTCGSPAEQRELTRYYMPLEPLRGKLTEYLSSVAMSARLRSYVDRVLAVPLPDLPVSTVAADGIMLPADPSGATGGQRMYSAFELAARFITAVDALAREQGRADWEEYAAAERPRTVLFFGFDNAFLRAIVFPAVLGAFTDRLELADTMVCNEFYLLDGQKFSTGRRHAIWGQDAFQEGTRDQLRFYLAATSPDMRRRNFVIEEYQRFVRDELVGQWEGWLASVDDRLLKYFVGVVPEAGSWNTEAEQFYGRIREFASRLTRALEPGLFSARSAAEAVRSFVAEARRFAEVCEDVLVVEPVSAVARTCMALELMAVRTLATVAEPLLPNLARRLAGQLGMAAPSAEDDPVRWVTPGSQVALAGPYFSADASMKGHNP